MPSLKDLRNRISSVKSTQKITSAMKMVAASRLKRAQERAESSRPYADRMGRMLSSLAAQVPSGTGAPPLMRGSGKDDVHLLLVVTSDRGLCGGFNATITREVRRRANELADAGKTVKLFVVGRKGRDNLRRDHADKIVETETDHGAQYGFEVANRIGGRLLEMFEAGAFDVATVVYNRFRSAISQVVTTEQLVPVSFDGPLAPANDAAAPAEAGGRAVYAFEPAEEQILAELLPRNLAIQIYKALLESQASEQGARMTAMDSATRNAGEMIGSLTMQYNRSRQAAITKELIEIISGAEAL